MVEINKMVIMMEMNLETVGNKSNGDNVVEEPENGRKSIRW